MADQQNTDRPQPGSVINPGSAEPPAKSPTESTLSDDANQEAVSADKPADVEPNEDTIEDGDSMSWQAPEFVAHDKSAGWYMLLLLGAVILAGALYLLTHDFITAGVVIVAALILAVYGAHKPKLIDYRLDPSGISINNKHFGYEDFRSFSSANEANMAGVTLMPLKRFSPPLSLYFAPANEAKVTGYLADRLPFEPSRRDMVDSLMRRIRF